MLVGIGKYNILLLVDAREGADGGAATVGGDKQCLTDKCLEPGG